MGNLQHDLHAGFHEVGYGAPFVANRQQSHTDQQGKEDNRQDIAFTESLKRVLRHDSHQPLGQRNCLLNCIRGGSGQIHPDSSLQHRGQKQSDYDGRQGSAHVQGQGLDTQGTQF